MFRVPLLIALALSVAFGGGVLSTLYALDATAGFGAIRIGPWEAFPQAQTGDADPYAKSHRARAGRLLYGNAEGLAFAALVDDGGERLSTGCTYRLSGQTPQARLWTMFVTGPDGQPMAPAAGLPSGLNSWTVVRQADSSFAVTLSASAQPGNWLALPAAAMPFSLSLTLFDTPTAGSTGLLELTMPRIEKTGCDHA